MFRTSSRQPVQVAAPAPPIVMSSQPIYIPAPKASSSGMNQPYTILVGSHGSSRRAPIEIVVGSSSSSSSRRDDHPVQPTRERRHSTTTHYHPQPSHGHSYEQPKIVISSSPSSSSKHHYRSTSVSSAPRSDVASYGGSVYGDVRSKGYTSSSHDSHHHHGHHRDDHYHSHGHSDTKRESSTSHRHSISVPHHHRTYSGSGDYLRPPTATMQPSSSPQKHARFAALPQSVPTKPVSLPVVSSSPRHSAPIQVASSYPTNTTVPRSHAHHRSSQSHDLTLYATRPRHSPPLGWFNRRGDEYLVERGLVRKAGESTKWNAVFNDYPEPGTGWMDHERRFIPASGGILKH